MMIYTKLFRTFRLFLALLVTLFFYFGPAQAETEIKGVRIGVHGDMTRVVFDLSNQIEHSVFKLADPYRIVIDLPKVKWNLDDHQNIKTPRSLINKYRSGFFTEDTYRIVFDLSKPVKIKRKLFLKPANGRPYRLVLDIVPTSRELFIADIKKQQKNIRPKSKQAAYVTNIQKTPKSARTKPVIVLDPGHGGVDPGAIGITGLREKDVVIKFSRILKQELEKTGKYKVYLTRNRDIFLKLRDRIRFAKKHDADLFISIHADSIRKKNVRGASVYTLSEKASDKEAAALARKENRSDLIAGIDLTQETDEVTSILIDLAQRETMNLSAEFAEGVIKQLKRVTKTLTKGHRFAGFVVLKAPDIPSILIELGFLSNRYDEKLLKKNSHQKKLAKAMVKSIGQYFAKYQYANR